LSFALKLSVPDWGKTMGIEFGRDICGTLSSAETREWLVTNGMGGYASGTVAGVLTRRYHGLLVAALNPPLGRTLLLTKLDETALYNGQRYPLYTNRWISGTVEPHGYRQIERFFLEGTVPVWQFACADALLEKRVWMQQGANTTYVQYTLLHATQPLQLSLKALVNYRNHHGDSHADGWAMNVQPMDKGICITAFPGATPFYLFSNAASTVLAHDWYKGFDLAVEWYRGLNDREDHLHPATLETVLKPGESLTVVASTELHPSLNGTEALDERRDREQQLLRLWHANCLPLSVTPPNWLDRLVLAADQFIVDRPTAEGSKGKTIMAGYHWFGDWGRDTMISLPGLTLATGRPEIARSILKTFAQYIDRGMLPNRFPDAGEMPEYNTVDATLWYFEAIRAYYATTGDDNLLHDLFPVLANIIDWHRRGTRYNIHLDSKDGLLYAGETGVQLTWMDAKVDDWVVTPRIGKPIEINALWYNALHIMEAFACQLGQPQGDYGAIAQQTQASFSRFWNSDLGYCYDVLEGPEGNDSSLRPNQLFAVTLPRQSSNLLSSAQQKAVVDACAQNLLTSHGLRSLSPHHPQYHAHYGGNQLERDGAYHQGTVWGWLLGPFVQAHLRVYNNPTQARQFLAPMANHLAAHGVGSLSEIFDGDAPMTPRGCIAQAWTVAEVLNTWWLQEQY
jgi:predicted glycogen debranching enzyme